MFPPKKTLLDESAVNVVINRLATRTRKRKNLHCALKPWDFLPGMNRLISYFWMIVVAPVVVAAAAGGNNIEQRVAEPCKQLFLPVVVFVVHQTNGCLLSIGPKNGTLRANVSPERERGGA